MIEFILSQEKNCILLKFIDNGISFNPTKDKELFDPHKFMKNKKRNGLGIHMIYKMTDEVSYKRIDDRNHLELKKVLRG